jgi:hypothetical protein
MAIAQYFVLHRGSIDERRSHVFCFFPKAENGRAVSRGRYERSELRTVRTIPAPRTRVSETNERAG